MKSAIIIPLAIVLVGCQSNNGVAPTPIPENQLVIAGSEHINWAWGYRHYAMYIVLDGDMLEVRYAESDSIFILSEKTDLTLDDILRLLQDAEPRTKTIPQDTVMLLYSLIAPGKSRALFRYGVPGH